MSQENVEIVRRAMDAFNAHDTDRLVSLVDPEIEFRSAVERKVYRGPAEVVRFWEEELGGVIRQAQIETDRLLDAGGDRVAQALEAAGLSEHAISPENVETRRGDGA
jgi:hypothetical protein